MSTQPYPLRLADLMDSSASWVICNNAEAVAAELRRLHELNQELLAAAKSAQNFIGSQPLNVQFIGRGYRLFTDMPPVLRVLGTLEAAIAKAEASA